MTLIDLVTRTRADPWYWCRVWPTQVLVGDMMPHVNTSFVHHNSWHKYILRKPRWQFAQEILNLSHVCRPALSKQILHPNIIGLPRLYTWSVMCPIDDLCDDMPKMHINCYGWRNVTHMSSICHHEPWYMELCSMLLVSCPIEYHSCLMISCAHPSCHTFHITIHIQLNR